MRANSRSVRGGMRERGIVGRYRPSEMDFQQAPYAYRDESAKMPLGLKQVITGFFNYHAVPTNWDALGAFRAEITERWRRTLSRRSQKGNLTWARMAQLADDWLPKPRILHPWPNQRFAVKHPRQEPYA